MSQSIRRIENNIDHYKQLRGQARLKKDIEEYFHLERRAIKFIHHIKDHFKLEHPDWHVKCKICDKTIEEICDNDNKPYVGYE